MNSFVTRLRPFLPIVIITLLAFWIRIYRVPSIPPALSWDEVSIGFSAWSILKTGMDEHSISFPLGAFKAYGDYKPPVSIYLTIVPLILFGLTEFAVRIPSVVLGTLNIPALFLFAGQLFPAKQKQKEKWIEYIPILSSILLAISPWHIQLSRAGFEGNIAVFFLVLGSFLVLKVRTYPRLLVVCWIPYVLAIGTFNSARYFAPMLSILLLLFIYDTVRRNVVLFVAGVLLSIGLLSFQIPHLLSAEARLRFQEVNIFSDSSVITTSNDLIESSSNAWWAKVLYNRRVLYARSFLMHFMDNFQPSFLFIRGDGNPKFSTQSTGQLYIFELPLLILGCFLIISHNKKIGLFLLGYLIFSILPASTARETPHALRIESALVVYILWSAAAISHAVFNHSGQRKNITAIVFIALYGLGYSYFHHIYFTHYSREYSGEWQYGYREAFIRTDSLLESYDRVLVTESIGRPYMYLAFYTKMNPTDYQRTIDGSFDEAGFLNVRALGKYEFTRTGFKELDGKVLYVLDPKDVPNNARIIDTIRLLNGDPKLVIFDLNRS